MEVKTQPFNFMVVVGIVVLIGGLFLGVKTFWQALTLFENPRPITKWIEIGDSIFTTEKSPQEKKVSENSNEKNPEKIENNTKGNSMTPIKAQDNSTQEVIRVVKIFTRMFAVFISIMLLWILAKISLSMIRSGTEIINKSKNKPEIDTSEV